MNRRIPYPPLARRPIRRPIPYREAAPSSSRLIPYWLLLIGPAEPLNPLRSMAILVALHAQREPFALELMVTNEQTTVAIVAQDRRAAEEAARAIRGAAPTWEVSLDPTPVLPESSFRLTCQLQRSDAADWLPLRDVASDGGVDPLVPILEAVQPLDHGELFRLRCLLRPAREPRRLR